jgi:hypothetical protein
MRFPLNAAPFQQSLIVYRPLSSTGLSCFPCGKTILPTAQERQPADQGKIVWSAFARSGRTFRSGFSLHHITARRGPRLILYVGKAIHIYDELKRGPRLYDVATPAAVAPAVQPAVPAAPVLGATTAVGGPVAMPTYRYVYQPDRILVIDPYTNITVQTIPR